MVELQHSLHVKVIRSDNGPEFLVPQFYASKGINIISVALNTLSKMGGCNEIINTFLQYYKALAILRKYLKFLSENWCLCRVIRYLKANLDRGLLFPKSSNMEGFIYYRNSTLGYLCLGKQRSNKP